MHGSVRGSKAFEGKLSKIEAVELKFTSTFQKHCAEISQPLPNFVLPKVLAPPEAAFQPFWVKLFSTLPPAGSI
jgi:hypothetical protein